MTSPRIIESRLRRDFIMPIRLLIPGMVPITLTIRVFMLAMLARCLPNSERVSYACWMTVSVIWCELSILPRSASRESAAEDLYASISFRTPERRLAWSRACLTFVFVRLSSRELSWCSSLCRWIARSIELDMSSGVFASSPSCSLISSSYNGKRRRNGQCHFRPNVRIAASLSVTISISTTLDTSEHENAQKHRT
jgi:hypothetical protein